MVVRRRARILVVEDEPRLGELVRLYLERDGHAVTVVTDGRVAIETFDALDAVPIDLVVLDLMLPGMSGEAVLTAIRERGDTPVLIASAKRSDVERIAGLRMGADDYLAKPYNPHELTARVAAILRRSRAANGAASSSDDESFPSPAGASCWTRRVAISRSLGPPAAASRPARRACSSLSPASPGPSSSRSAPRRGHAATGRRGRSRGGRPRRQPPPQAARRPRRPVAHRDHPAHGLSPGGHAGSGMSDTAPSAAARRRPLAWRLGTRPGHHRAGHPARGGTRREPGGQRRLPERRDRAAGAAARRCRGDPRRPDGPTRAAGGTRPSRRAQPGR